MGLICGLLLAYMLVLLGRVVLSWFPLAPDGFGAQIYGLTMTLTEPILGPLRRALPRLQGQLDHILEHVRRLQEVDVSGVEPTAHAVPIHNSLRKDEVRPGLDRDEALHNAPAQADGQFLVPRILE